MRLESPFYLGGLPLPNNIFYAPLAGCSDFPFRQMVQRYRPGLFFCEMVKVDALVRHDVNSYRLLDYSADMHPIGAQLCGSKPKLAAEAAKIIEDLGFDLIDLNCGCPVDKVTKDGSGSGMLKFPERIGELLSAMRAVVKIPITIKIRAGWDENSIQAPRITQIAEEAGACAIAIHGRTREQGYKGAANWDHIRLCKEASKEILVIGNGDLFSGEKAPQMFAATGCDALLVSRGTLGQPWILEDMMRALQGEPPIERGAFELRQALLDHFAYILSYQPERQALLDFRRVGCWYLKRWEGAKTLRMEVNRAASTQEVLSIVKAFAWESLRLPKDEEVHC